MRVTYQPGNRLALVGKQIWLIGEIDPHLPLVQELYDLVRSEGTVADVLDLLVRSGLRSVASFAIVTLASGSETVIVRGDIVVSVVSPAGRQDISASGVMTWLETRLSGDIGAVTIGQGNDVASGSGLLPLEQGVVLASTLRVESAIEESGLPSAQPGQAPVAGLPNGLAPATASASRLKAAPVDPAREPARELEPVAVALDDDLHVESTHARPVDSAAVLPRIEPAITPPIPHRLHSANGLPMPGPSAPPEPRSNGTGPPAPLVSPGREADRPEPQAGTHLISAVPGMSHPQLSQRSTQPSDDVDVDMTVSRATATSWLAQLPAAASSGVTVSSVRCPTGHLNAPSDSTCRLCRSSIGAQAPVTVTRPVLGRLRLSTGDFVTLDRGVLMGRNPSLDRGRHTERPHLVRLSSPDHGISRTHLEIQLDGWHVLVVDRNSTNGTVVTLPGGEPQRLFPDEPLLIPPGAVVGLGEDLTFIFEVVE